MSVTDIKTGLCESCKELRPVAYTDPVGREYCTGCFAELPVPTVERVVSYLMLTIPFQIGDRVEARTAGVLLDGVGTIKDISIDPENFGTPAYPSFLVEIEEKAYPTAPESRWYMERQLRSVTEQ
jgi:hypothetical protein